MQRDQGSSSVCRCLYRLFGNLILFSGIICFSITAFMISMGRDEEEGFAGCEPDTFEGYSCSGPFHPGGHYYYCFSYSGWQGNANRMLIATWVIGCAILALMFFYGVCKLDRGEKSLSVLKVLLVITMVGWAGLSFGGFIMGIDEAGHICRGAYVNQM